MTTRQTHAFVSALSLLAFSLHDPRVAGAQVMGTYRWQTQPYCNVVTLTIVQQGPAFQLSGSDDLCGAGTAPVTGTAVVAAGGVGMGLAVALPNGRVAHLSTTVSVANFAGTWTDSDGNTGPFAFVNASTGGSPRPAPTTAAIITSAQLAPGIFGGTGIATTVARGDHNHDSRYYTQGQMDARATLASFAQRNGWFAVNTSATESAKLSDTGGGAGGPIVAISPVRIVLNGAVTIGNQAGTGPISMIDCWFEGSANGGAFTLVGLKQSTESIGNSNHDERYAIPLSATVDVAPGSYNVRIMCQDTFKFTGSSPVVRAAAFSAIAVSR